MKNTNPSPKRKNPYENCKGRKPRPKDLPFNEAILRAKLESSHDEILTREECAHFLANGMSVSDVSAIQWIDKLRAQGILKSTKPNGGTVIIWRDDFFRALGKEIPKRGAK